MLAHSRRRHHRGETLKQRSPDGHVVQGAHDRVDHARTDRRGRTGHHGGCRGTLTTSNTSRFRKIVIARRNRRGMWSYADAYRRPWNSTSYQRPRTADRQRRSRATASRTATATKWCTPGTCRASTTRCPTGSTGAAYPPAIEMVTCYRLKNTTGTLLVEGIPPHPSLPCSLYAGQDGRAGARLIEAGRAVIIAEPTPRCRCMNEGAPLTGVLILPYEQTNFAVRAGRHCGGRNLRLRHRDRPCQSVRNPGARQRARATYRSPMSPGRRPHRWPSASPRARPGTSTRTW